MYEGRPQSVTAIRVSFTSGTKPFASPCPKVTSRALDYSKDGAPLSAGQQLISALKDDKKSIAEAVVARRFFNLSPHVPPLHAL